MPHALALDAAADLFVTNESANTVTEYAPPYTGPAIATIAGLSYPFTLALDAAGDLFVGNYVRNTVTEYAPPYTGPAIATVSSGVNVPYALLLTP